MEPKNTYSFKGKKYPYSVKAYIFTETFPTPARPEMANLKAYDGVTKTITVQVKFSSPIGVEKIELYTPTKLAPLASSTTAPFNLEFDPAQISAGIVPLFVQVTDKTKKTLDSLPLSVIVVNNGKEVTFTDGSSGTLVIPQSGEASGVKHHWDNPDNIRRIMAVVDFEAPPGKPPLTWQGTVGIGECPKNGTVIGAAVEAGKHFVMFKAEEFYPRKGESFPYTIKAFLFK